MIDIPADLSRRYDAVLSRKNIPNKDHVFYRKWLRYFLDFCHKYNFPHSDGKSLQHFIRKLQDKNQSPAQQKQANHMEKGSRSELHRYIVLLQILTSFNSFETFSSR